jgi:leader peptidase (prepilin peptidase)/N-methyltransferase
MSTTWQLWTAAAAAAVAGVAGGQPLVDHGLRHLDSSSTLSARLAARVSVGAAGVVAVIASRHAGSWWLLPALLVWAYTLAAAATCDAVTQRIPTPLVRQGGAATACLVLLACAATTHWRWALLAAISAAAGGAILLVCWRFAGAGFGDVRLAVLGGLGLVHPTHQGLVAALAAFVVITLSQATTILARGANRRTQFPYGPAIAIAFAVAACV